MDEGRVAEHADVFQSLADETRLDILISIIQRYRQSGPVSFSEAMEAAGFEDSGHFNYHLDQLDDQLLFEREGEYLPTTAANELIPVVLAGRLVDYDFDADSPTVGSCMQCGHSLVADFEYRFLVTCQECWNWTIFFPLAADVAAENDLRTLAVELDRTIRDHQSFLLDNRCSECGGRTAVRVRLPEAGLHAPGWSDVYIDVFCENCFRGLGGLNPGQYLLGHPTVRDYCRANNIDPLDRPQWEHLWTQTDMATETRSRDPWELETYIYVDGCRLVAIIEDDGSISHVDHVRINGDRTG